MGRITHYAKQNAGLNIVEASLLHFEHREAVPASIIYDSVEGAYVEKTTPPYSASEDFGHTNIGGPSTDYAKKLIQGRNKSKKKFTSGTLVFFACGKHFKTEGTPVTAYGSLYNLTDSPDYTGGESGFYIEDISTDGTLGTYRNAALAGPSGIPFEEVNTAFKLGLFSGEVDDSYLISDLDYFSWCAILDLDGDGILRVYASNGKVLTFDRSALDVSSVTGSYVFNEFDLTVMHATLNGCTGFIRGLLHFNEYKPTPEDAVNCAKHHYKYGPRGIKDVWPGWDGRQ